MCERKIVFVLNVDEICSQVNNFKCLTFCGCTLQAEEVDEEVDEDVLLGLDEEEEEEEDDSGEDKSWRR